MARLDTKQINRNREVVENSVHETPWHAAISDSDSDYGEKLYDQLPPDKVGFLPKGTKE